MGSDPFGIVGSVIDGRYRVDSAVGEGGFGVVYRGLHLSLDHPIAIKCLKIPAHFTAAGRDLFLTRFRDEGRILCRMGEHPSIVRVFDVAITRTQAGAVLPYLVLEWLDGADLQEQLASAARRYSEAEALELLRPAIDAIAMVHDGGIAHRDLKPANLFIARTMRGSVLKVLDFGIAKAMQDGEASTEGASQTSSGFHAFSPQYGAPEQFHSKRFGPTGPWTDVHALGLILGELLVGRPLQGGESPADCLLAALSTERPTPRTAGAKVSDELEALCAKAVALAPANRFQNARQMLARVEALLQIAAAPTTYGVAPTQLGSEPPPAAPSPPGPTLGMAAPPTAPGAPPAFGVAASRAFHAELSPAFGTAPSAAIGAAPPPLYGTASAYAPVAAHTPAAPWPAPPTPYAMAATGQAERPGTFGPWVALVGGLLVAAALSVGGVILVLHRSSDESESLDTPVAPCRPGRHLGPSGCVPDEASPGDTSAPAAPTDAPQRPPPCPPGQVADPNGHCLLAPPTIDQAAAIAKAFYDSRGEFAGMYTMVSVELVRLVPLAPDRCDAHVRYRYSCARARCPEPSGFDQRVFHLALSNGRWLAISMGPHLSASP